MRPLSLYFLKQELIPSQGFLQHDPATRPAAPKRRVMMKTDVITKLQLVILYGTTFGTCQVSHMIKSIRESSLVFEWLWTVLVGFRLWLCATS